MHHLLALALLSAAPVKPHPYTIQDQVTLKRLTGFKVNPAGTRVVFQLRTTDLDASRGRMDLWLVDVDGQHLTQLTTHPENDTDPAWSPDGRFIYFLSNRGGSNQVWRISAEGGEATVVTTSPIDVDSFRLSPDGALLAFSADTFIDCDTLECTKKRLDEKAKSKASGKVYDSLFARHWDTWSDGRRAHLFVTRPGSETPAVDVMKKMNADSPVKPFGGADDYTFTSDSKALVFSARDVGRTEAWSTDVDLFQVGIDGAKAALKLTTTNRATDSTPVFSHDGKWLAYLAMARPGFEADRQRIVLRGADGKERSLGDGWDRSAESLTWSADDKTLYVTAQDVGQLALFSVEVASGKVTPVLSKGHITGVALAKSGLVLAIDSLSAPSDLYTLALTPGATPRPITAVNAEALASIKLGEPEQFSFTGSNKDTVYAYLVKPVDFDAKKKYPMAFLIHGGPQGSFGNDWHYRWNPQVYAAHGYVAVMVDFHGSTGYGQAFTDAIRDDWGGGPLEDLKKGYAAALAKYPFIAPNRACALGASYGGYMINWIASQWNDQLKCLVAHDGNLDEQMAYYDTEELWFPEWEHKGTPWENKAGYTKSNPIDHVDQWKLPMLVVHGGRDYRVVDTQGLSSFTVLQRRGIPSKFLYFPDENHWVLKPANSILWHETVLGWLDEYTKAR